MKTRQTKNSFPGERSYRDFQENGPCLTILQVRLVEACQQRRVAAGRKDDAKEKSMKKIRSFWIKTFPDQKEMQFTWVTMYFKTLNTEPETSRSAVKRLPSLRKTVKHFPAEDLPRLTDKYTRRCLHRKKRIADIF